VGVIEEVGEPPPFYCGVVDAHGNPAGIIASRDFFSFNLVARVELIDVE